MSKQTAPMRATFSTIVCDQCGKRGLHYRAQWIKDDVQYDLCHGECERTWLAQFGLAHGPGVHIFDTDDADSLGSPVVVPLAYIEAASDERSVGT